MEVLGRTLVRHPRKVAATWLLLLVISLLGAFTGFGTEPLLQRLHTDAVSMPGTESGEVLRDTQPGPHQGASVLVIIDGVSTRDGAQMAALAPVLERGRRELKASSGDVESVVDPFLLGPETPQAQALMSTHGTGLAVRVQLRPGLSTEANADAQRAVADSVVNLSEEIAQAVPGASARPLSQKLIADEILDRVRLDLVRGEALGLPVALLLMLLVFGGLLAAGLPLIGALTSIGVGMFCLWLLTHVQTVDSFILNVVSLIGLALSIDYGLLIVSRFREEAHARLEALGLPGDGRRLPDRASTQALVRDAVAATVASAGRTVFYSAVTIALAILSLLVMSSQMLRTIGVGGCIVVILAVLTAVTLVPVALMLIGRRLLPPSPLSRVPVLRTMLRTFGDVSHDEGAFSRLARWVHRHPWGVMLGVLALLAVMVSPLATLSARYSFADYIPRGTQVHATYEQVQAEYPALAEPGIVVVADRAPAQAGEVVAQLRQTPHVTFVAAPVPVPSEPSRSIITARLDLADPVGRDAARVAEDLRAWDPGYRVLVGGPAALQHDFNQSVLERAPLALAIMVSAVLILLFLMTGSVVVPLKALLINLLSLAASLGATWWLFEHGVLGLPRTLGMETFVLACAISFGFGLAMDYEVFLLARVKEYWDAGEDNDAAVEHGLQRSGRIITSAAAIIIAVFLGFVMGDLVSIKQIGVVLAVTVLTDATLVRMLLVPATMTVLGRWNWWAPAPLRWLHRRFGITH